VGTVKFFGKTGNIIRKEGTGSPTKYVPEVVEAVEEIIQYESRILRHLLQQVVLSVET
jgi:hypothetical protein